MNKPQAGPIGFDRYAKGRPNYECSNKGDRRFSALNAKLADGRSIEEAYQLDVKGYRSISNDWRSGKGNPPLVTLSREQSWLEYLNLWVHWAEQNPKIIEELCRVANGKILTDSFAFTPVNQARALYLICTGQAPPAFPLPEIKARGTKQSTPQPASTNKAWQRPTRKN